MAIPFTVFEEELQGGGLALEGTAKLADELRSERLKDEPVILLKKDDLSALADAVAATKFGGDYELTLGGDFCGYSFHRAP